MIATVNESKGGVHEKAFSVGKTWERYDFSARPDDNAVFVTIGVNADNTFGVSGNPLD